MSTYFLERGARTSGAELALRFPLPRVFVDGLTVEKRVSVQLQYTAGGGTHPLTIGWQPLGKGPLPSFAGTLSATPLTDSECRVAIEGSYAAPGGLAGKIFDELIGVRIANATLTALLDEFKRVIEADYAMRLIL